MKGLIGALLLACAALSGPRGHCADARTAGTPTAGTPTASITVFGAASLTNALQDLGDAFTKEAAVDVKFSFAASSALAHQIENGARADVFLSADVEWMDYLQARNLIQPATRHDVVGNRLVLIAPVGSAVTLKISPNFPLAAAIGDGRLATGDPDSVPAGRYAKAALASLGVWNAVSSRLIRADSVRSALAFVDRGEAPLGIVYETDARIDKNVRVIDVFPASSHPPIVYPAALTASAQPVAEKFLTFIRSSSGGAVLKAYGFLPLRGGAAQEPARPGAQEPPRPSGQEPPRP